MRNQLLRLLSLDLGMLRVGRTFARCAASFCRRLPIVGPRCSLPTHHTRSVAQKEGRSGLYLESAFGLNADGIIPDPVPAIMDLCAERDIVHDCGHVDAWEAVALVREAVRRGCKRLRTHCGSYASDAIAEITTEEGTGSCQSPPARFQARH